MEKTKIVAEPGKQELFITRIFDAPRELVFKVTSDPKEIPNWWGPRNMKTVVDKMDVRPGGSWRYIQTDTSGNVFAFHGVYHDVKAPERDVRTVEFEGMPGHVLLQISKLEDIGGGKTKLTVQSISESVADRDGMLQMDMEKGINESHERLDELLKEMMVGKAW
jgi:uncharacterized protein YndB with AHSA1/START domain